MFSTKPSLLHIGLFLATCFTTLSAGAMMEGVVPWETPGRIVEGLPFAATLMGILLIHEMGHYLMARRHGTPASLPYFIPAPSLIGTFGAVIRMGSQIMDRRALMDIGATGPLAGFVVALAASVLGLAKSTAVPLNVSMPDGAMSLGDSLLFKFLSTAILGIDPDQYTVLLHPVAFAGWIGLLVTSLNLIPVGQLDGGHICYALLGPEKHARISRIMIPVLIVMGIVFWPGWLMWGVLLLVLGKQHPPVMIPYVTLDERRQNVGWISLVIFVLTFTPVPFSEF